MNKFVNSLRARSESLTLFSLRLRLAQGSRDYVFLLTYCKYHHLIIPTYRTFPTPYDSDYLTGVNTFFQHSDASPLFATKGIS